MHIPNIVVGCIIVSCGVPSLGDVGPKAPIEDGVNTDKYVTSFIGVAPTDNPKLCILVTLYNPTGKSGHQGGTVAAPVAGKILSEAISYLELKPNDE